MDMPFTVLAVGIIMYNYTDPTVDGYPIWDFNGDINNPTFTPSLLNRTGSFAEPTYIDPPDIPPTRCHLFVTNGVINYCGDCTHEYNGKTGVQMREESDGPY